MSEDKRILVDKPEPDPTHREVKGTIEKATNDVIEDLVYSMAKEGMSLYAIARYFGVTKERLDPYHTIWDMGKAALEHAIFKRQIDLAFNSKFWNPAFFCGVQFAGQNTKAIEDDGMSSGEVNVKISVVGGANGTVAQGDAGGDDHSVSPEEAGRLH